MSTDVVGSIPAPSAKLADLSPSASIQSIVTEPSPLSVTTRPVALPPEVTIALASNAVFTAAATCIAVCPAEMPTLTPSTVMKPLPPAGRVGAAKVNFSCLTAEPDTNACTVEPTLVTPVLLGSTRAMSAIFSSVDAQFTVKVPSPLLTILLSGLLVMNALASRVVLTFVATAAAESPAAIVTATPATVNVVVVPASIAAGENVIVSDLFPAILLRSNTAILFTPPTVALIWNLVFPVKSK